MALVIPNREDVLRSQLSDIGGAVQTLSADFESFLASDFASRPSDREKLDKIRSEISDLVAFTQTDPSRAANAPRKPAITAMDDPQAARASGRPAAAVA